VDWRGLEAASFNEQERSNLRSWGYDMPDPAPDADQSTPTPPTWQELEWASFTPEEKANLRDCLPYDPTSFPERNTCGANGHSRTCAQSPEPGGLCGVRAPLSFGPMEWMTTERKATCTGSTHSRSCTESDKPRGLCGQRSPKVYRYEDFYGIQVIG
jgi:hypothetical protein